MRQLFGHCLIGYLAMVSVSLAEDAATSQSPSAASEQGTLAERARRAVVHSLPYLEADGVAWMKERRCMSCHHVPFLLWTHRSAAAHGFKIDPGKLDEWDEWSRKDSLQRRNLFKLSKVELEKTSVDDIPQAMREKFAPILDRAYESEAIFVEKLAALLSEEELKAHRDQLLKTAELSRYAFERSGGGLDVLAELILMSPYHDNAAKAGFRHGLAGMIEQMQLPNGSWTPGQQFLSMRQWSTDVAIQNTTMWAAMALDADRRSTGERSDFVERAGVFIKQQAPHVNNCEWLATRMLFEKQFGTVETLETARKQLLSTQNADGGWSWIVGAESDPYTTGFAVYALQQVRRGTLTSQIEQGRKWIVAAQLQDGSWYTPSRKISDTTDPERLKERDKIYHYWGTAWCVLALLDSLPTAAAAE